MDTGSAPDIVKHTVIRMVVVACMTTALGFAFFQQSVFNTRMVASQFLTSGVTAAIAYAALHTPRLRDGLVALLVWYIVETFLVGEYNSWLPILYFGYVAGIGAAVYLYVLFVRREIVRGALQRIAAAGVITAVANAVIVIFLGIFTWRVVVASFGFFASTVFRNLQFGTLIGIAFGAGAELAEYIIRKTSAPKAVPS